MMPQRPELLAPAGDMRSLVAAVENGADAVYLGVREFSARAYAGNFTLDELEEGLHFAHLRGVGVYVTLNTLIKDHEIEQAVELMQVLDRLGVDAIIVQDLGLLSLARRVVPAMAIHVSTQMTIHNTDAVCFLKDMGVKRVVLARELDLASIKTIVKGTGVEVETFIHGALCISYSGQCLMSSMIGGRSGNRGHCAQPCRKGYSLLEATKKVKTPGNFLLSPRDLNVSSILPELIEAGIGSFKIEGRMKRAEYVAGVVRVYRRLIDRYMSDPDKYYVSAEEDTQLAQLFNREFTTAYFKADHGDMLMSRHRPYNRGVTVGRVLDHDRRSRSMTIELTGTLSVGDGIGSDEGDGSGAVVQFMYSKGRAVKDAGRHDVVSIPFEVPLPNGALIYKTLDSSLMKELQGSFEPAGKHRKVPVSMKAEAIVGCPFSVSVWDDDGNYVSVASDYVVEPARNKATGRNDIHGQMDRLGNTVFQPRSIEVHMSEAGVFIPIRVMNDTRNKAVSELEGLRVASRRKTEGLPLPSFSGAIGLNRVGNKQEKDKPLLAVSVSDIESMQEAIACGTDVIYFDVTYAQDAYVDPAYLQQIASHCTVAHVPICLQTPLIVKDSEMPAIEGLMFAARALGFNGVLASNHGVFRRAMALGLRPVADSPLNIFNSHTASVFRDMGAELLVLSPEMDLGQIKEVSEHVKTECIVHGRLQLMESEHGLITALMSSGPVRMSEARYGLMDEKGFVFPVVTDPQGRTHILNSRVLCLLDDLPHLIEAGVERFRIDARMSVPAVVAKVTSAYRKGIDSSFDGQRPPTRCADISAECTRGHYHRGVL